jgi:hypothetical protein
MRNALNTLIVFVGLSMSYSLFAKEELIVIQTVSTTRQSFVIQKGLKDGIAKGMEVIFGNENVSVVCKAYEVSREYSLWKPVDKWINIPFNKQEIISMNTHSFGNIAVDLGSDVNDLTPKVDLNIVYEKIRTKDNWAIRYSYGGTLNQSSSSVSSNNYSKRKSEDYIFEYGFRLRPEMEISLGARYDYAVYRLTSPELDVPTTRVFLLTGFTYHFINLSDNKNNFYAAISLGIGKSNTVVNNATATGIASILPQARFGYLMPIGKTVALTTELSLESVSSRETFSDGVSQNTSDINAKISIGLRF